MGKIRVLERQGLPTIRKVIRVGRSAFICGVCRRQHRNLVLANDCMNQCWLEVQELYPLVFQRRVGSSPHFRCRFCSRDYEKREDGLACASDCKAKKNRLHFLESQMMNLPITIKKRPRIRYAPMSTTVLSRFSFKNQDHKVADVEKEKGEAEAVIPIEPVVEMDAAPAPVQPKVDPEPEEEARRHRSEYKKEWIRKDAKYQCCHCLDKFFTKKEVTNCFESHFDENGYEKPD